MRISSFQLLFVLSTASAISGASVAERNYTPYHDSGRYEPKGGWSAGDRNGQGYVDDEYTDDADYSRNSSFNDDLEYNEVDKSDYQHKYRPDRYRDEGEYTSQNWEYNRSSGGGSGGYNEASGDGGRYRQEDEVNYSDDGSRQLGKMLKSGFPARGDSDMPNKQESTGSAQDDGSSSTTPRSSEPLKSGNQPADDTANSPGLDNCHGNIVDGKADALGINADICIGLGARNDFLGHTPVILPHGAPGGVADEKVGDAMGTIGDNQVVGKSGEAGRGTNWDALDNVPKILRPLESPAEGNGDVPSNASGLPDALSGPNDQTNQSQELSNLGTGRCEDIAAKVRHLLGINADAVICLSNVIKINPRSHQSTNINGFLSGILDRGGAGKDVERKQREYCETIKAHVDILGITVDAVICLPEILIKL